MATTARSLYTTEQLVARETADLNRIFNFAGMDATTDGTRYGSMGRDETIATARRTQVDVLDVLYNRAQMENVARGMSDRELRAAIEIIDDLDEGEELGHVQVLSLAILREVLATR
jgi:hypothetical protein